MVNQPIKILLIEDNPGDVRLIQEMLVDARTTSPLLPAFQLAHADRLAAGLDTLAQESIDVVVLDLSLPDSQGFDTFARIRTHISNIPIILLTGFADDVFAVQAVQAGAQDYLVKEQMDSNLLVRTIRYAIERMRTQEKTRTQARQQAAVAELGQKALVGDDLSGILEEAATSIAKTLEVAYCLLLELLPDQRTLLLRAGTGELKQLVDQATLEIGSALPLNYTLFYDNPLIIEDLKSEPRFSGLPWLADRGVISTVNVVIEGQKWPFGLLAVYTVQPRTFTEDDIHFLQAIANVLATAVQRKQVEAALRASEERFRQVVTSISDHIYVTEVTEDGRRINRYISPVEALTGYSEEKFLTDWSFWPLSVIHPDDQAATADHSTRLAAGQSGEIEYRLIRADGQIIWVRDSGRVVTEGNSRIIYGVVGDITQRKQYERELEAIVTVAAALRGAPTRADLLSVVLEQLLALLDVKGAALEIVDPATGEAIVEAAGGAWSKAIGLRTLSNEGISGHILSTGQPYVNDDARSAPRLIRTDLIGELHFIAAVPLIAQMHPIGVLWVGHQREISSNQVRLLTTIADIAANAIYRITLFEELQAANAELANKRGLLAQRVQERTAELSAANAELARAARLKDEFLANMSHELRTPLNAILGMSEILRMNVYGMLNEKQLNALNHIEEGGRHLLGLINDILDLSKIEAGKLELIVGPISVKNICQSSLRFIQQMAQKKRIKLFSTIDHTIEVIEADERRLKQILVNLLSNAVKFTPEEGQIGLELESDEARNVVHFTVWDTGIGIAEEEMARLFKPFVQIDSRLSRQYEGTGLGLSLVSRLVEMHGGGILVKSEVGRGSRFTISLPWQQTARQRREDDPSRTPGPIADQTQAIAPPPLPPDRQSLILLVEDNEVNIITTRDFLRLKGYRVIVARNGLEAIEQTREERPDLILMDIQMPRMDGLEATRRIRADAELASIPIIALTAMAMPGDRERCLKAGVSDYLSKPISLDQLLETIEAQLQGMRTKS
jgi:PAS domain S-box-containing protein